MTLSYASYLLANPTSALTQGQVEGKLALYKSQLSPYFRFDSVIKTELVDIDFCRQDKVFLKAPLIFDNQTIVEKLDKKTRMITSIANEIDFVFKSINELNQTFTNQLDFGCLGCTCECTQLKITGIWGLLLPDWVELEIYQFINDTINADDCDLIQSEKIGEYSVSYKDSKKTVKNVNNILTLETLQSIILLIQPYFLYV